MIRIKWPVALATLFLILLGWYVIYPLSIVDELHQNEELMSEVFSLVQELIQDTGGPETSGAPGSLRDVRFESALFELTRVVIRSGIPLIWIDPADSVLSVENLPFDADIYAAEGQDLVKAYVRRLEATGREPVLSDNPPSKIRLFNLHPVGNLKARPAITQAHTHLDIF